MSPTTSSTSNLIEALADHLPEDIQGNYKKGWQELCNAFANDLADDPDRTLEQLLQSQIMMTAPMYFRTVFEIHRLTNDPSDTSHFPAASGTGQLPEEVKREWIPRMNRQQKMLIDMIDSCGRFKKRITRLDSSDE